MVNVHKTYNGLKPILAEVLSTNSL